MFSFVKFSFWCLKVDCICPVGSMGKRSDTGHPVWMSRGACAEVGREEVNCPLLLEKEEQRLFFLTFSHMKSSSDVKKVLCSHLDSKLLDIIPPFSVVSSQIYNVT